MRTRREIDQLWNTVIQSSKSANEMLGKQNVVLLEVLLDIRDLLMKDNNE